MKAIALVLGMLGAAALFTPGCGGGGGNPDEKELEELREALEFTEEPAELEALITSALGIASRHAGEPLGDEAFAFAEETLLGRYRASEGLFGDSVPRPSAALGDYDVGAFQSLAGFIAAAPAQYDAAAVRDRLHSGLLERAGWALRDLEWAYNSRSDWASELATTGTTEGTWFGLVARLDNGLGASMGYKDSEAYAQEEVALRYLGELAAGAGASPDFLAGWPAVLDAVALGAFTPPSLDERYEDGKFITTYTGEAVAGALANAEELGRAIEAARRYFPPLED